MSWTAYDEQSKAMMDEAERNEEAAALDESDLSDATQARPEDVPALSHRQLVEAAALERLTVEAVADVSGEDPDHFNQAGTSLFDAAARMPSSVLVSPTPLPPPAAYVISSEEGLRRAFSAIRHARRRLAQNKRMQAPEVEALERELFMLKEANARANKALEEEIAFRERAITVYAQLHRKDVLGSEEPRKGEKKTRDYGIGRISYRAVGGGFRWRNDVTAEDEAALLKWATDRTGPASPLTKLERVFDLEAIKRFALSDRSGKSGAPPGLEWVEPGESIVVKVGEEK